MPGQAAESTTTARGKGQRLAVIGLVVSLGLGIVKLVAGLVGNSYALVADAVESFTDIAGSVVVWSGLHIAGKAPSERHPYGYGKAESLAAMVVAVMVIAAGIGIAVEAVTEIVAPHHAPEPFTLVVLVAVVIVKFVMFRVVRRAAIEGGSPAVEADAWHHYSDALTSLAAFIGISLALIGGKGWEPADDWAALAASAIIAFNGWRLLVPAVRQLLDVQDQTIVREAVAIAERVPGVVKSQKAVARMSGSDTWVDMHIWVDGNMNVRDAHALAHRVKQEIQQALPRVRDVLVHVEPAAVGPRGDG